MSKNIRLEQALEIIIEDLMEKGILIDSDKDKLLQNTLKNLEETWGKDNLPSGPELKDPMMMMKLSLTVVATDTLSEGYAKALTKNLHKMDNANQLTNACKKLMNAFELDNPEGAPKFTLMMKQFIKEIGERHEHSKEKKNPLDNDDDNKKEKNVTLEEYEEVIDERYEYKDKKNSPSANAKTEDNTFVGKYEGGVLITALANVFKNDNKSEQVLTSEEISSMGIEATTNTAELEEKMNARERLNEAMTPSPPGST